MKQEIKTKLYKLSKEQLAYIIEQLILFHPELGDRKFNNLVKYCDISLTPKIVGGIDHQFRTDNQYNGYTD
jgi:hypothetical protein